MKDDTTPPVSPDDEADASGSSSSQASEAPEAPEAPAPAEAAPPAPVDPIVALEARLAGLEKEKKDTYDRLLRSAADFENYKKRVRREIDDTLLKAREQVLREMLPVADNLERALGAATAAETGGSVVDGVRLVLRQFASALEKFDVKTVESVGKPFDPTMHEAISQIESAEHPAGTVISEMQRGYSLGPRLLRPAMVAVSRRPAGEATAPPAASPAPADAAVPVEAHVVEVVVDATSEGHDGRGSD